jgi:hypothetical protein
VPGGRCWFVPVSNENLLRLGFFFKQEREVTASGILQLSDRSAVLSVDEEQLILCLVHDQVCVAHRPPAGTGLIGNRAAKAQMAFLIRSCN